MPCWPPGSRVGRRASSSWGGVVLNVITFAPAVAQILGVYDYPNSIMPAFRVIWIAGLTGLFMVLWVLLWLVGRALRV